MPLLSSSRGEERRGKGSGGIREIAAWGKETGGDGFVEEGTCALIGGRHAARIDDVEGYVLQ
uniref:Uncharacterized protein n=1 Tax=Oryza glumipatula TaxID=40148 RepID=A0A0D9Y395_9ORYZ